jgi:hypothetical protein
MVSKAQLVTYTTKLHANLKLGRNMVLIRVKFAKAKVFFLRPYTGNPKNL